MTTVQDILAVQDLTIDSSSKAPETLKSDALIVGVSAEDNAVRTAPTISAKVVKRLAKLATLVGASSAHDAVSVVPAPDGVAATLVVFTGLGAPTDSRDAHLENLRQAAGSAVRALSGKAESVVFALPADAPDEVQAIAEGAGMGAFVYSLQKARTADAQSAPVARATVAVDSALAKAAATALAEAATVVKAVHLARVLVDLSPDVATPEFVAAVAVAAAKKAKVKSTVLSEKELTRGGYGGLLGVGQGSVNGPRLVKLEYAPSKPRGHVSYVGKGITFDSGGLSLKPPASMMTMKSDMAGAAAVIATVVAAAQLQLPVAVTGWLCLAENLPSATATRPGDVLSMYSGHTVEVLNTDAEGRLVLADGLWAAGQESPDLMVDIATLTGAQLVALGTRTAGVMGNAQVREQVCEAAAHAGESVWAMPLPEHLRPSLKSNVADIKNMGDRYGGMMVAGLFLEEFVPEVDGVKVPWAHIDIAGPSFNESSAWGYTPKEGTGFGVRTLLNLARQHHRPTSTK